MLLCARSIKTQKKKIGALPFHQLIKSFASESKIGFNYDAAFHGEIQKRKETSTYRVLSNINHVINNQGPKAYTNDHEKVIDVWCSNDYLGMRTNQEIADAIHAFVDRYGVSSTGSRNIAGHNQVFVDLENSLAQLHQKQACLVFNSGYVANETTLATLAQRLPGCVYFSDELNHASMIHGIRNSRAEKVIYKHNDIKDLEEKLNRYPKSSPKVIAFESIYSMNGDIAPIESICKLAKKYGALTYLDEVHAVGMYGEQGAGVAAALNISDQVDIITGSLAKSYSATGGYAAGSSSFVDFIRSFCPGFIYTSSLPPHDVAAALTSVEYLKASETERALQKSAVRKLKDMLTDSGIPFLSNQSHIVPIMVGHPEFGRLISRDLIKDYNIYLHHINYPTVAKGTERLRVTPTPLHNDEATLKHFVNALKELWKKYDLRGIDHWRANGFSVNEPCHFPLVA
ncbi:5-aminolevulinate synthase [Schizosaccharomyces cryophilus OY26]|uniref:5-aminolevulinate synthase n=1 Tax=Schizosaccharomyces cryophilus (strain OY26 / ATCC MYA-4695 / CBS 11777 / NBRC 106824 / NRRL Y48691) TaxID=653667 RepID=S9X819_SCHCR|nr:5-aminolevulinate synthase [Schizosaccharomyces cryophilus OY26]EPY53287.1 5-aminolevulinate synthase [Schizosaccharomyces cryophilus OY26]